MLTVSIGYIAAFIGTFIMAPQTIKMFRTKKVEDVALGTCLLYSVNSILWFAYGLGLASKPLLLANGIGFLIGAVQLALKLKHGKKSQPSTP
jgi:MtN3 and saliva related transmembrane protein